MPEDKEQMVEVEETETIEEAAETEEAEEVEAAEEVEETEAEESAEEEGEADDSEDVEFACGSKKKKYEEDKDEEESGDSEGGEEDPEERPSNENEDDEGKKKPQNKNSLDEEALQARFDAMEKELEELRAFKLQQENLKKDALINKYFMLSDEDKAEIIANKEKYSYDEIEAKLALIYVKKNVDFSTIDGQADTEEVEEEDSFFTFSLDNQSAGFIPPMVEALRQVKQSK